VVAPEHEDSAHHGDEHAVEIEARDARCADGRKQKPTDHGADDTEHDVEQETLPVRLTILLPMKPAISPNKIQLRTDIYGSS